MELKMNINDNGSVPIIATSETEIKSFNNEYYVYKHLWKPIINEQYCYEVW